MNYSDHTQHVHTFTNIPRLSLNKQQLTAHDNWDDVHQTTVQLSFEGRAISDAVVDFLAHLHGSPYRSREDIELLQRFAGAMGLDYPHEPGVSK
tara:strand:- start:1048 stop:1329 length:282 start_codon:yes stop_codon:yes gene_type:complete